MEPNSKHTQFQVVYDGETLNIDAKLVPLLRKMWSLGIKTNFSCEGDAFFIDQTHYEARRYRAYIQMKHTEEALFFVQRLLDNHPMFKEAKVSFDLTFSRDPKTDEQRITIRFPHRDIDRIIMAIWNWEF